MTKFYSAKASNERLFFVPLFETSNIKKLNNEISAWAKLNFNHKHFRAFYPTVNALFSDVKNKNAIACYQVNLNLNHLNQTPGLSDTPIVLSKAIEPKEIVALITKTGECYKNPFYGNQNIESSTFCFS